MRQWVFKASSLLVALGKMLPEDLVVRPTVLTTLDASKIDVLDHCGDIDTVAVLPSAVARVVTDGPAFFRTLHRTMPSCLDIGETCVNTLRLSFVSFVLNAFGYD